jgi:UDP:flavonoid glycosyltransferase YjiC (YdhE family)
MKVGVMTWGSEGDVRPLLALAGGLAKAGHDVQFAYASIEGRSWTAQATALGCRAQAMGEAQLATVRGQGQVALQRVILENNPVKQVQVVSQFFMEPLVDELWDVATRLSRECDVVVTHLLVHPAVTAAAKAKRPVVPVLTAPVVPTRAFPPMGMPDLGVLNPALWWLAARVAKRVLAGPANALRQREGLPLVKNIFHDRIGPMPCALVAVSATLVPRPPDWPPEMELCGYLHAPDQVHEPLSPELEAFLAAGAPPVYVTLGSMLAVSDDEAAAVTRVLVEAAVLSGQRVIVQAPWESLPPLDVPERVFKVSRANHALVFPRCAAVVHHGGAGTTHAACRAGVPSVLVPYVTDQFFWQAALARRGLATPSVPRKRLKADTLAARLRQVVADEAMRARARVVGEAMRSEDGVAHAVTRIAQLGA